MKLNNIRELIHTFANQRTNHIEEAEIKSGYWYKGNRFYHNSGCIAEVDFDKKLLFYSTYSTNGFGNGYSCWQLQRAFHSSFIAFETINWYIQDARKEAFLNILERRKESVAALLDCSRGRRYFTGGLYDLSKLDKLDYDYKSLDISIDKVTYEKYNGWSFAGYKSFQLEKSFSVKEFLELDWTEDLKIAEFKSWCYTYSSELPKSKEKRLEIYNNLDERSAIVTRFTANVDERRKAADELHRLKLLGALASWLNGGSYYYKLHEVNPTRLRLNGGLVETSKGEKITVVEARKLYRIFKLAKSGKVEIRGVFGGFQLHSIEKQDEWIMKIGCHTLHESVIEEFYPQIKNDSNN